LLKRKVISGFAMRIGACPELPETSEINFLLCYGCYFNGFIFL
jgi:hypothetical protein